MAMKQAFSHQLARGDELPPVAGLYNYLLENVGEEEAQQLYQRFMWEMRRESEPRQALQAARFAGSYAPNKQGDLETSLQKLKQAIQREPILLAPGQNQEISSRIKVVNLWDRPVYASAHELGLAGDQLAGERDLTIVLDDVDPSTKALDKQIIWNVPVDDPSSHDSWYRLCDVSGRGEVPEWVEAYSSFRSLASPSELIDEHMVRARRTREVVQDILMSHSYGPSIDEVSSLEEDELAWAFDHIDTFFEHYTQEPRLALACHSLKDFSPLADWQQHGPQGQRALLATVTGDNPLLADVLAHADRIRIGALTFTGDPDDNGDDLLSAVLPAQECTVVLKPHVLDHTVFLSGVPHPAAELPIPSSRFGFYNTAAVGADQVLEMLRSRAYLCLLPASEQSIRDYFQGRSQELEMEEATANPAFQALVTAAMVRRNQGEDNPMVKAALRVAAAHAIYVGLNRDPMQDPICGIHLGGLELGDVEQIVVALRDSDEWEAYHRSGELPRWLRTPAKFFAEHGIRLRARSHMGHGSMAVAE